MKNFLLISLLIFFNLGSFSQERELSDYEKYRLTQESEKLVPDTIYKTDTVYVQSKQKDVIVNNYYIENDYPDYRYMLSFGYRSYYRYSYYYPFYYGYRYYHPYRGYYYPYNRHIHYSNPRRYVTSTTSGRNYSRSHYKPYNGTHVNRTASVKEKTVSTKSRTNRPTYSPSHKNSRVSTRPTYNTSPRIRTTTVRPQSETIRSRPTSRSSSTYQRSSTPSRSSSYSRPPSRSVNSGHSMNTPNRSYSKEK